LWENHVFVLWSKLGLHRGQMPLSHGPWVLPWLLHPKSRVPWGSIHHDSSANHPLEFGKKNHMPMWRSSKYQKPSWWFQHGFEQKNPCGDHVLREAPSRNQNSMPSLIEWGSCVGYEKSKGFLCCPCTSYRKQGTK
jgi:hypothetical protein